MANATKTLNITKQVVNTKRHVVGYVVGGKKLTRGEVVKLARRNKISGVEARQGATRWYVRAINTLPLSSLPEIVE